MVEDMEIAALAAESAMEAVRLQEEAKHLLARSRTKVRVTHLPSPSQLQ